MIQFERRGIQIIDFILFIMFCLFCIISYMTSNSSYFFVGDVFLTIMVFIDIDIIKIKKIHKLNDEQLREINYMLTKKKKIFNNKENREIYKFRIWKITSNIQAISCRRKKYLTYTG